ncbi:MAG: response regulator [Magnetococcales bacterium]|nr:response regulator [Magnetococcales bacterium]
MERQGRVLIVDDERFNITVLVNLLRPYYETLVAKSGEQALRSVHSATPPDLILLDIQMPEMDGYEVCRQLKANAATRAIPIIFVTAMNDVGDEVKGFELGAVDYIAKPISPPVVYARVRAHLEIVMARNQIQSLNGDLSQALVEQKMAYEALHQARIELAETQAMAVMTKAFEKFVPKQFLECLAKEGLEHIKAGTVELSTITVMFTDIRSFTKLSEQMSPHDIFALLNNYIGRMQKPIERNNGFIDKFIGDAIMALFDGSMQEQATHAVQAAIGMQQELQLFNRERAAAGLDPVITGIGLHIGEVMMGTLGNDNRMDSTVIGDAANLAARLEGLTKYYQCPIIISDELFALLEPGHFLCRPLDRVVVKGRSRAVLVYEVFNTDPEPQRARKLASLDSYRAGLELFYGRRWQESLQAFQHCLEQDGDDVMSRMYAERSSLLMAEPPAADWNGIFEMQSK